jgi:ComF family protein
LVRQLVHEFKYGRRPYLRHPVGRWLVETMSDLRLQGRRFDLIVPVPLHPARERERGFNQATLLAELLSDRIGLPVRLVLERARFTTSQTAHDRTERMKNLHDAFRLRKKMNVRDLRVLLIDDVLTTGSTLSECARVLKKAGALSVFAATAARA